jgi:hypothetical protein
MAAGLGPIVWESEDPTRVEINESGLATGKRIGATTIRARSGSLQVASPATVIGPEVAVDQSRTVTAIIGPAGGAVETQAANGVRYRLELPGMAVAEDTPISITPVTGFGNAPFLSHIGAVRFAPDGLKLTSPAKLTIELPAAPPIPARGIYFTDDGSAVTPWPFDVSGSTVTIPVLRFSGTGVAQVAEPDALPTAEPPGYDVGFEALVEFADLLGDPRDSGVEPDVDAMIQVLRVWYRDEVRPALTTVARVEDVRLAIGSWRAWLEVMSITAEYAAAIIEGLGAEIDEARSLAGGAIKKGADLLNQECIDAADWVAGIPIIGMHQYAFEYDLDRPEFGLDEATMVRDFCVKIYIVDLEYPDEFEEGQPAEVIVRPGIGYGGGPPVDSDAIRTRITPTGATDNSETITMDPEVIRTIVPTGDHPFIIDIESCFAVSAAGQRLDLTKICDRRRLTGDFDFTYFEDFETGAPGPEWSARVLMISPSGEIFLGTFANQEVTLTLPELLEHDEVTIEFDFYAIGSWNGNRPGNPDIAHFRADGNPIFSTTFSNSWDPRDTQAYPDAFPGGNHPYGTGASAVKSLGFPDGSTSWGDSTYSLSFTFPHTSSTLSFSFGGANLQEIWGIDNVRVVVR